MKIVILYRSNSEHERRVLDFQRDFRQLTNKEIELLDVDSVEGSQTAALYDVLAFPTVLAVANDGVLQHHWDGSETMPLIGEVSYYAINQ